MSFLVSGRMRQPQGTRVTVSVKDKNIRLIARGDFLTYWKGESLPAKLHNTHTAIN